MVLYMTARVLALLCLCVALPQSGAVQERLMRRETALEIEDLDDDVDEEGGSFVASTSSLDYEACMNAENIKLLTSGNLDKPRCTDGFLWSNDCFDVDACAKNSEQKLGKYAFVFTCTFHSPGKPFLPFLDSVVNQARDLERQNVASQVDVLFLANERVGGELNAEEWAKLNSSGVQYRTVPWDVPPELPYRKEKEGKAWCGPKDLIRLHIFNLTEYDAVLYLDTDVEIQGNVGSFFQCAASGYLLNAPGPCSPLNLGVFAVKPADVLMRSIYEFSRVGTFDRRTGWANSGFRPNCGSFVGDDCGQGFVHTLFQQRPRSLPVQRALESAGFFSADAKPAIQVAQVNNCVWDFQGISDCGKDFTCADVRIHHKTGRGSGCCCHKKEQPSPPVPL